MQFCACILEGVSRVNAACEAFVEGGVDEFAGAFVAAGSDFFEDEYVEFAGEVDVSGRRGGALVGLILAGLGRIAHPICSQIKQRPKDWFLKEANPGLYVIFGSRNAFW